MSDKPLVIGIAGSIRSNYREIDALEKLILSAEDRDGLTEGIRKSGIRFSNTDIAVAFAAFGARQNGADIKLLSIPNILKRRTEELYENLTAGMDASGVKDFDTLSIDDRELGRLFEYTEKAQGIVLGTPVYFGDRSSVANKFLQLTNKVRLLKDKAFGVVSSGAKRNGGQETANIYSLFEGLSQGAIAVGNGPPTSQYGGTVWAGDRGKALDDTFGLETCYGTGRQVAQLANIFRAAKASKETGEKLRVSVLVTMDTKDKRFHNITQEYFSAYSDLDIDIIDLIESDIYRCIACDVCPFTGHLDPAESEVPSECVIKTGKDAMRDIHKRLVGSDCIVLVGVNTADRELVYRYQAFMERTRFIRRNDFELSYIPIVGMLINEPTGINNPIFNIKVLTSFIRHNTFMLKPLQVILIDDRIMYQDDFSKHLPLIGQIRAGRELIDPAEISYKATGYSNKSLDHTIAKRK